MVASSETQNYLDGEIHLAFEAYDAAEVGAVLAEKDDAYNRVYITAVIKHQHDYYLSHHVIFSRQFTIPTIFLRNIQLQPRENAKETHMNTQPNAFIIDFTDGTTSIMEGYDVTDAVKRLGANEERNIVTIKRLHKRVLDILAQHDKETI